MRALTLNQVAGQNPYFVERIRGRAAWVERLISWKLFGRRPFLSALLRLPPLRERLLEFTFHTRERIVEYPWLHRWLPELDRDPYLLDVGSAYSWVPFELASLGYRVAALDLNSSPLLHPRMTFTEADVCAMPFADSTFDFASCVSTLEHIGVPSYGIPGFPDGDKKALSELRRVLKHGGRLFLSVPFGRLAGPPQEYWQRVYGLDELDRLLRDWKLIERRTYARSGQRFWEPARPEDVARIETSASSGANGVCLNLLEKS